MDHNNKRDVCETVDSTLQTTKKVKYETLYYEF